MGVSQIDPQHSESASTPTKAEVNVLTDADLTFADSLRAQAGWNQTMDDWRLFTSGAYAEGGVARVDGRDAGTVSLICHGQELAWIGMLLVDEELRGRGIGKQLLLWAMNRAREKGVATIGLDATPAGQPLYLKTGFKNAWSLHRWEGKVVAPEGECELPAISEENWPSLLELDLQVFGVDRSLFLKALARMARATFCLVQNGRVRGYGMCRNGRRACYLGPIMAEDVAAARQILHALQSELEGEYCFWDAFDENQAMAIHPSAFGLEPQRPLYRMFLGQPPRHRVPLQSAIADPGAG